MARALYVLVALLIIGGYGYASVRGLEMSSAKTRLAPGGVRGAHTGGFWYGGYRGGK
jgi:hypothetical protein